MNGGNADGEQDVPSPIDLRRPRRILELGAGPGLLCEAVLRLVPDADYTLFDFSLPMLEMSRERLARYAAVTFVHGDFKQPGWVDSLNGPFDAVVAMQAAHEIRHKRHVPGLYRELHGLLRPRGALLICDHMPGDAKGAAELHSTVTEQHAAFYAAGFVGVRTVLELEEMYLCAGTCRPAAGST